MMNTQKIWGIILFVFGSLLYTLNQTFQMLLFANPGSEIIFTIICYFLISAGIAMMLFESNYWSQIIVGFMSILLTIFILNASLLIYDSFNSFRYSSTDYFVLLQYAINLGTITDEIALWMTALAPTIGILFWMLISREDLPKWYYFLTPAAAVFLMTWGFAALKSISIF